MKPRPSFLRISLAGFLAAGALGLRPSLRAADAAAVAAVEAKPNYYYTLTVTDEIRVQVVGEDDLNSSPQRIDAQGNLTLALVGEVHVAGLTRDQAEKAIEDAYVNGRFLRKPQVTISIEEYAPRIVSIQGSVKNPGQYTLPNESTFSVVELVTKAGGFTDVAKGTDVYITHNSGGSKNVTHVDVDDIIKGKSSVKPDDPSLLLQPGDIVFVPERLI